MLTNLRHSPVDNPPNGFVGYENYTIGDFGPITGLIYQALITDKTSLDSTSVDSIRRLMEEYEKSQELAGPLVPQLSNSLTQAEKFFNENKQEQAVTHMEDFLKLLNNPPMSSHISKSAKAELNSHASALIKEWINK
jgi:hypothetical protein